MVSEHDFEQNLEQNFEELAWGNYVTVMLVVANITEPGAVATALKLHYGRGRGLLYSKIHFRSYPVVFVVECGRYSAPGSVVECGSDCIQVTLRGVRYALACRLLSLRILRGFLETRRKSPYISTS